MGTTEGRPQGPTKRRRRRGGAPEGAARLLDVPRFRQPDGVSCGPTCRAQVMEHWGERGALGRLVAETRRTRGGGR